MNTLSCHCQLLCLSLLLNWDLFEGWVPSNAHLRAEHKASVGHIPTYMTVPRRGDCPGACTSQRLPTEMASAWAFSSVRRWVVSASRCARSSSLYRPSLLRFRKERTESVGGVGDGSQTWSPRWSLWPNEIPFQPHPQRNSSVLGVKVLSPKHPKSPTVTLAFP